MDCRRYYTLVRGWCGPRCTIDQLNTPASVPGQSASNLLGRPIAVAVDQAGHIYDMTHRRMDILTLAHFRPFRGPGERKNAGGEYIEQQR